MINKKTLNNHKHLLQGLFALKRVSVLKNLLTILPVAVLLLLSSNNLTAQCNCPPGSTQLTGNQTVTSPSFGNWCVIGSGANVTINSTGNGGDLYICDGATATVNGGLERLIALSGSTVNMVNSNNVTDFFGTVDNSTLTLSGTTQATSLGIEVLNGGNVTVGQVNSTCYFNFVDESSTLNINGPISTTDFTIINRGTATVDGFISATEGNFLATPAAVTDLNLSSYSIANEANGDVSPSVDFSGSSAAAQSTLGNNIQPNPLAFNMDACSSDLEKYLPQGEVCGDNIDNDYDGIVDEGCCSITDCAADCDGDGILNCVDTDPQDACIPVSNLNFDDAGDCSAALTNFPALADCDYDNDGDTNAQECAAGSDPFCNLSTVANPTGSCCNAGDTAPSIGGNPLQVSTDCTSSTADLTSITANNTPAGSTIVFTNSINATNANVVNDATAVTPGTYYAVFYNAAEDCFASDVTQVDVIASFFCVENVCPDETVNLNIEVSSTNAPAGTTLTFHTGIPASNANRIIAPTMADAGTYFAAFYDATNDCYSGDGNEVTEITVNIEPCTDTDMDGIFDVVDIDDDNDGIPDVVEAATAPANGDTDGDGIPDTLDLDADNDGIPDILEAGGVDADGDGTVDNPADTDGDGLADVVDTNPTVLNDPTTLAAGLAETDLPVEDTDNDGQPDFQDLDADNDGINDIEEAGIADVDNNGIVDDVNPDGTLNNDPDMDGLAGSLDPDTGGTPVVPADTDGDMTPDYQDLDSDNDGINDVIEGGNGPADTDGDGTIDEGGDADMDGIPDVVDETPNAYGDGTLVNPNDAPTDTDMDGVPDYQDLDSDNDSINDVIEGGNVDPDGDGQVDNPTVDTDGDGIPDSVDGLNAFGDEPGTGDDPTDTDNDGIPDSQEVDSDNDGTPDIVEAGDNPSLDGNGDGTVDDTTDPDGDGIVGDADLDPNAFGDAVGAVQCNIDVAVWLEGSYEVTQDEMRTDLNDQQLLPGQDPVFFLGTETPVGQPYSVAPWNYNGTEGDAFNFNILGVGKAGYDAAVTDWVLVSLRTETTASSTICTQAGLLLKDGTITFPDACNCALTQGQEVYIVIEHRNHLPVMTPTKVAVTASGAAFDFRTQQSFVTFTGDGQKMLEGGVFGMFAANGDQINTFGSRTDVNATDESIWTGSNSSGDIYIIGDFDMNGDVNADDESLWLDNTGKSSDVNF